ncbi:MAG TPA: diaminopimelate epimerase [Phycisphaerales bacterium]|nr:diaminopimelate epimerase [Phycisphaerales bacterium]
MAKRNKGMTFTKMQGIGNDYVYVNVFEEGEIRRPEVLAQRISDRHFGVGSDGLILVMPASKASGADVRMRMFNADGSEGMMCGNGIRCVCKLARERGITKKNPMRVETKSGVLELRYNVDGRGNVGSVTVDMGLPRIGVRDIPVRYRGEEQAINVPMRELLGTKSKVDFELVEWELGAKRNDVLMTCVNMGNPHVVMYCKDVARVDLEKIGPMIERAAVFPERVNVHVVEVKSKREARMRTWERGSGITLACGTGASAVCVAGVLTERTGRALLAHLPGGDLKLKWDARGGHVFKTGPAEIVFEGVWEE